MATILVSDTNLTNIADAIRTKNGSTDTYKVDEMAEAIEIIESGITPSGELAITENGTYDVTNYASANVNVASSGGSGGSVETVEVELYDDTYYMGWETNPNLVVYASVYENGIITTKEFTDVNWIDNLVVGSNLVVVDTNGVSKVKVYGDESTTETLFSKNSNVSMSVCKIGSGEWMISYYSEHK